MGDPGRDLLADPAPLVRAAAARPSTDPASVPALRALLGDLDLRAREAAVGALRRLEPMPSRGDLESPDAGARAAAVRRRRRWKAANDPDPAVRREALWVHPAPPPAALADPDPTARLAVLGRWVQLVWIDGRHLPLDLSALLDEPCVPVRALAARLAAWTPSPPDLLDAFLADPAEPVFYAAAQALRAEDPWSLDHARRAEPLLDSDDEAVRRRAAHVLSRARPGPLLDLLARRLLSARPEVRAAARYALRSSRNATILAVQRLGEPPGLAGELRRFQRFLGDDSVAPAGGAPPMSR